MASAAAGARSVKPARQFFCGVWEGGGGWGHRGRRVPRVREMTWHGRRGGLGCSLSGGTGGPADGEVPPLMAGSCRLSSNASNEVAHIQTWEGVGLIHSL